MSKNILGVILARAGSKGVPDKNMLKIGGVSLLGRAILSAKDSKYLTRLIVSTESDTYIDEAIKYGADVPFKRPEKLATDTASTWEVMKHAVEWLETNQNWKTDILVILQPTTPFRTGKHIDDVIEKIEQKSASVCITVKQVDYPPQWMFKRDDQGKLTVLISGDWPGRRQDAEPAYQPNGMVYALRRHRLYEKIPTLALDIESVIVDPSISINIDESIHYDLAKLIWKNENE